MADTPKQLTIPRQSKWLLVDWALVIVFAAVGRATHGESIDPVGVLSTAWPFLVGCAIGQLLSRGWRNPAALVPTGILAWLASVAIGMALRMLTGGGAAPAFVIVATGTVGFLLLGWRIIVILVRKKRTTTR